MEEEEKDMHLLSCHHRCHLECLKGMIKVECPLCRSPIINLPPGVADGILAKGREFVRETEEERSREFMRELREEMSMTDEQTRIPPQLEILMALRYLCELGIPPSRIPSRVNLEIDPESPLPTSGSIFQTTINRIIDIIQRQVDEPPKEEDSSGSDAEISEDESDDDEENPFRMEGQNFGMRHYVRTTPAPNPIALAIARRIPMLFNVMSINLQPNDTDSEDE